LYIYIWSFRLCFYKSVEYSIATSGTAGQVNHLKHQNKAGNYRNQK